MEADMKEDPFTTEKPVVIIRNCNLTGGVDVSAFVTDEDPSVVAYNCNWDASGLDTALVYTFERKA